MANKETDERYTLDFVKREALKFMGLKKWSLDAAACKASHLASKYLTKADNGLLVSWWGDTVWNPPWSNIGDWVAKAWVEWDKRFGDGRVVTSLTGILPATRTDLDWWQTYVEKYRDKEGSPLRARFLPGRNRYGNPGDLLGKNQGTPEFGTVILGWKERW